jgi:glyoxylase-like metal-dependent hydrolase (beta-lactamase superfamily II)
MIAVHPLQTGTVQVHPAMIRAQGPGLLRLVNTFRDRTWTEPLPILAWLIDHPEGPIVVDTGEVAASSDSAVGRFAVTAEQEIGPQLRRHGVDPATVQTVVLTHLHGDHMNGAGYFAPERIVVSDQEYRAATEGWAGWLFRNVVRQPLPQPFTPRRITFTDQPLGPFAQSYPLTADGRVVLVPTPGHTFGHMSVVVITDDVHYFLAGDVTYSAAQLHEGYLSGNVLDARGQQASMDAIRRYAAIFPTVYLPTHDPAALDRFSARTTLLPLTMPVASSPLYRSIAPSLYRSIALPAPQSARSPEYLPG